MAKAREHISDLKSDARSTQQEVSRLNKQVAYQRLLIRGMWDILKEKFKVDDAELLRRIEEIEHHNDDEEAAKCPQCSRFLQDNSTMCVYCGTMVGRTTLF